ncbi:MAG: AarF/ABC1/UbiB kinase family protein [Candidatus Sericytochromatia bacterium]|nr:AarF/ABC1/UbiB kinase family protein [Candidatus Sericytochromatia bacterium]
MELVQDLVTPAPPSSSSTELPATYDPAELPAVLESAGRLIWRRRWQFFSVLTLFVWGFWWDNRFSGDAQKRRQRKRAIWLKDKLVDLGATFIKIGQVLSTRPDLVPMPYIEVMASLQDQVPPFDSGEAQRIIAAELGCSPTELFEVFNPFPIAAASIGQVYRAKLKDTGDDVVVKVQRPGLLRTIRLDMAILRQITSFIDSHPRLSRGMPYTAILDEFGHSLFVQANYLEEGRYAEKFRENFKNFKGVTTPRIHWNLTTEKVMTMDFVDGFKPTDLVALHDAGLSFQQVVHTGVRATIKQILEDGFFHADVHPGNLFVDRAGQLVYIDFGMVGSISPFVQEKIVDVFLHSVHRQYDLLVDDFIALEFLSPHVDRRALIPVAQHIFQSQYGEKDHRLTVKEIFAAVSQVLYEYPFRIPEKIAFILRTIITLEGIIHQLWPDFRFLQVAGPYAAKILLTDAKASIREKLVDELFIAGKFRPDRLSTLFGSASKEPSFKFGEVTPAVLRYLTSPEGTRVRNGILDLLNEPFANVSRETHSNFLAYAAMAAEDPDWTWDDLLAPLLAFLETPEGIDFLRRLLSKNGSRRLTDFESLGDTQQPVSSDFSWDSWVEGRTLSETCRAQLFRVAEQILQTPDLILQPVVERAAVLLKSPAGKRWFQAFGERLARDPDVLDGRFLPLLARAAEHPHMNIAPLIRTFFELATGPHGKPWQSLLLLWFRDTESPSQPNDRRLEPLWQALRPLLADGRLRISELAVPTLGWFFSGDGEPVRQEVLSNLRERLPQVDWGGVAQGLWRAAGNTWNRLRSALEQEDSQPSSDSKEI